MPDTTTTSYRERLWNALESVILPHIRPEERDGVRGAVREFEGREKDYFEHDEPAKNVPMGLTEKAVRIFKNILALPGIKQLLGPYGAAIETAMSGRPVGFDPTTVVFPRGLTPIPPDEAPTDTLERYLAVAPDFRTYFTNDIIRIVQQMDRVQGMDLHGFQLAMGYLTSAEFKDSLTQSFFDLRDLLYEHGSMLTALHNYVKRSFFAGDTQIRIYRVHMNMTQLNERDGNNKLGNLYIEMMHLALQSRFETVHAVKSPERTTFMFAGPSISQAASTLSGIDVEVRLLIKNSLEAFPETTEEENAEKERLTRAFGDFDPQVVVSQRVLSTDNLLSYAIRSQHDADVFKDFLLHVLGIKEATLQKSGFDWVIRAYGDKVLDFEYIKTRATKHPELIKTSYALITKALLELIADLCAQTNYFEKEVKDGRMLFSEADLPKEGTPEHNIWLRYLRGRNGFVGPGIYDPASHGVNVPNNEELRLFSDVGLQDESELERRLATFIPDPSLSTGINDINRTFPPFNRIVGHIFHDFHLVGERLGGSIQEFLRATKELAAELPPPHIAIATGEAERLAQKLAVVQKKAHDLSVAFRNLYRWAVTEPRHKLLPRVYESFPLRRGRNFVQVDADFILQEVALMSQYALRHGLNTLYAFAEEFDSTRARSDAIAQGGIEELDIDDKAFNSIMDPIWELAYRYGLPLPALRRDGGDHITISFTNIANDGKFIDPYEFALEMQRIVREKFKGFKFQEYTKVTLQKIEMHGSGFGDVTKPEFIEEMRQDLNLAAQPQELSSGKDSITIGVEYKDLNGHNVEPAHILEYLRARGIQVISAARNGETMKRLLTWQRDGRSVYGSIKPAGFEEFRRTLTITLVLGEFPLVIYSGDEEIFRATESFLNLELGKVKTESLPNKEGRADLREASPMYADVDGHYSLPKLEKVRALLPTISAEGFSMVGVDIAKVPKDFIRDKLSDDEKTLWEMGIMRETQYIHEKVFSPLETRIDPGKIIDEEDLNRFEEIKRLFETVLEYSIINIRVTNRPVAASWIYSSYVQVFQFILTRLAVISETRRISKREKDIRSSYGTAIIHTINMNGSVEEVGYSGEFGARELSLGLIRWFLVGADKKVELDGDVLLFRGTKKAAADLVGWPDHKWKWNFDISVAGNKDLKVYLKLLGWNINVTEDGDDIVVRLDLGKTFYREKGFAKTPFTYLRHPITGKLVDARGIRIEEEIGDLIQFHQKAATLPDKLRAEKDLMILAQYLKNEAGRDVIDPVNFKKVERDSINEEYLDGLVRRVRDLISFKIKNYRARYLVGEDHAVLAAEIEHDTTTGVVIGAVMAAKDIINWYGSKIQDNDYTRATRHRFTRLFNVYQLLATDIREGNAHGVMSIDESRNAETLIDEIVMRLWPLANKLGRFIAVAKTDKNIDKGANIDYQRVDEIVNEFVENGLRYSEEYVMVGFKKAEKESAYVAWVANDGPPIPEGLDVWAPGVSGMIAPAGVKSSGYGLYIVKKLAEAVGWRVTYERDEVEGLTIFKIFIPIENDSPSGSPSGGGEDVGAIELAPLGVYENDRRIELLPAVRAALRAEEGAPNFVNGARVLTGSPVISPAFTFARAPIVP